MDDTQTSHSIRNAELTNTLPGNSVSSLCTENEVLDPLVSRKGTRILRKH